MKRLQTTVHRLQANPTNCLRSPDSMANVLRFFCAIVLLVSAARYGAAQDGLKRDDFADDPRWDGFRNRLLPEEPRYTRQDFGFRSTNLAGGKAAGEIGGRVQRSTTLAKYAAIIPQRTLQDRLSASGKFAVPHAEGGSGVMFGWFHETSTGWRTPNSLALRLDGNGGKFWVFGEYGTRNRMTGGIGAFEGDRYQTTPTKPYLADGAAHDWSLDYDPRGADEDGIVTFRIDDRKYSFPVALEHKADGAELNRFGIWNVQTFGDQIEVYLDDLVVDGQRFEFNADPNWEGRGNDADFIERVIRPYHDFGYSLTRHAGGEAGEIGGTIFRDEHPAYYGAEVSELSLDDELRASGRLAFVEGGADSAVAIGWFDHESKRTHDVPEYKVRTANYLGILLEGPSRAGHYFRPAYSTSQRGGLIADRDSKTGAAPPILLPDGKPQTWSLHYDPNGANGNGRITVTLDGVENIYDLRPGDKAQGARFDRFGLFNLQSGGHHVRVFIDDLSYTAGRRTEE